MLALSGVEIDIVISGRIQAVFSIALIQSLRKLGATVYPWVTNQASRYITAAALELVVDDCAYLQQAPKDPKRALCHDMCLFNPTSPKILNEIVEGNDDPAIKELIEAYLQRARPIMAIFEDPLTSKSCGLSSSLTLRQGEGITAILAAGKEEGSWDQTILADEVAHRFNRLKKSLPEALVCYGSTKGYVDEVRYFSNYSSGHLGSLITAALYRRGFKTHAIVGPCKYDPKTYSTFVAIETNEELEHAIEKTLAEHKGIGAFIMATAVLDFVPKNRILGKISSKEELKVQFKKTPKILAKIHFGGIKVGFKFESGSYNQKQTKELAARYLKTYDLTLLVLNFLSEVDENRHIAYIFRKNINEGELLMQRVVGKEHVANEIVDHIEANAG